MHGGLGAGLGIFIGGGGGGGGAGLGGAIFVRAGVLHVAGCTFDSNTATGGLPGLGMGATAGQGKGGAIYVMTGVLATSTDTTYSANAASDDAATSGDDEDVFGTMY